MTKKLLFRHTTSTLLRTALLLGVAVFVNIQQVKAQEMPDAFETVDPADILADNTLLNDYYYIQFYIKKDNALNTYEYFYLADRGDGNPLRTKDFIPFAKNIQWKLVKTGDNQYKLQSGENNYVYFDYSTSVNLFKCTSNSNDASILTYRKRSDGGYEIMLTDVPTGITNPERTCMQNNNGGNGWAQVSRMNKNNARVCLRFAKLKTTNVAYLIFYQDPTYDSKGNYVDGNYETYSNRDWFTQRHYLTYSGTGAEDWASVITNGNLSGSDVSCFYKKEQGIDTGSPVSATIVDGVGRMGSRGIVIQSSADATQDWDTQLFIRSNETFSVGTVVHLEFDCKASKSAAVSIQGHNEPGDYVNNDGGGDVNFTEQWQHIERDITITDASVRTFAFNLSKERSAVKYYIDNIVLSIQPDRFEDSDVSSRSSIMNTYNNWIIPTTANYHKDGLWVLEETSAGSGHFNIKKYGTSDYVKTTGTTAGPLRYTLNSSNPSTGFVLGDANANRFTVVQNDYTNNYMNYAGVQRAGGRQYDYDADGWYVLDYGSANNTWKAGFLPVEVPAQDEFYRVLLGVKRDRRADSRIKLTRESDSQGSVTVVPLSGSTMTDLYGATFTVTSNNPTNVFQIKNLPKGCYDGITIEFGSAIPAGYNIHTYGGQWDFTELQAGITSYTIDLSSGGPIIDDFTIFTLSQPSSPITISACYFTSGGQQVAEPDCGINEMLNYEGKTSAYSSQEAERILWELEQDGDYQHFRLKAPDGSYYQDMGQMTYDPSQAAVYTNESLFEYFDVKWFYVDPALSQKEIDVSEREIIHKDSYLREYADDYPDLDLGKHGMVTDKDSDWKDEETGLQKTNHFEITHYVRKGDQYSINVEFPTVLGSGNDHRYFQRFFNYDNEYDLDRLKSHINLDLDGSVQYYLYKNGMVTGEKIFWEGTTSLKHSVQHRFKFTNTDGQSLTVAADVSRYSDYAYKNETNKLSDDLEEPSLTMRYVYYMNDAKDMATRLTACTSGTGRWLEEKVFHFPSKRISYSKNKWVGYRGQFIGVRHVFSDYWVYDDPNFIKKDGEGKVVLDENGNIVIDENYIKTDSKYSSENTDDINAFLDRHLVSAVNAANDWGKIVVRIEEKYADPSKQTGVRLGGWNPILAADHDNNLRYSDDTDQFSDEEEDGFKGFYYYDKMYNKHNQYGNSRFVVFRYPVGGEVTNAFFTEGGVKVSNEAYLNVYFVDDDGNEYQMARFTLIFDPDTETLPWTSVNGSGQVKGDSDRDPKNLIKKAGKPIAKVSFDYPSGDYYKTPGIGATIHSQQEKAANTTIANSSLVPLSFDHTNYSFDGDNCNWGSYAMVSQKRSTYGNDKAVLPANDVTYGYGPTDSDIESNPSLKNLRHENGLDDGFLYIDASEQPGDICAIDFEGEFCASDQLICSGWITGSNRYNDTQFYRCPGAITLTVKGEDINGKTNTIYRFCPGQCYELDNGTGIDGSGGDADHVVWQQFFFKFSTDKKYERYWLEVNNNCVSSNGGDFMLDNIEVYTIVPEVDAEMNTPLCVKKDGTTEMRLLKLEVNYNKLVSSSPEGSGPTPYLGFVFLDKVKFLTTFKTQIGFEGTLDDLAEKIETGYYDNTISGSSTEYQAAFDAALLRNPGNNQTIWKSDAPTTNMGAGVMYFKWSKTFENDALMPVYSFDDAVNKKHTTYRYTDKNGIPFLILNGNYPVLPWKTSTDYYIVPANQVINSYSDVYSVFNICSQCSKASTIRIEPPYHVLGLESSETTNDYVVCEGQIPTILLDLKGYTLDGKEVDMNDLNFDWWLGNKTTLATLENYHNQDNGKTGDDKIKLDEALSILRTYYPAVTSLDGITKDVQHNPDPKLTVAMVEYLQSLVDKGELILHQKSVSIPAEKASNEDPYFYLVACPIHDEKFDQALNPAANQYVSYFCDEPQGLRIKVGQKAPRLKTGFVPGENGFETYNYPTDSDPVLSIRLAKAAQFEKVRNAAAAEDANGAISARTDDLHYLWLPIRNAQTQTAPGGVIKKAQDDYIYLASTNDPDWDKKIYKAMSQTVPSLPVVGRIVQLNAVNIGNDPNAIPDQTSNRLCVYFTQNFEVREGYSYTLSLPFQEELDGEGNASNACDGTILINLKIVPDYEVWTGGADNTDWNNDQNWRRADGNTDSNVTDDELAGLTPAQQQNLINLKKENRDELYVEHAASTSPLYHYTTNKDNYRTTKDRLFRKGFAPLYCTHVLLKSDEWGDAPVLYDAIDTEGNKVTPNTALLKKPFPNLRDWDGWDGTTGEDATKATATSILRFDMQARLRDIWEETYGEGSLTQLGKGEPGDLIAEMYQVNSCDEIVFQPGAELLNAHLLNYNSAWVEYQLDNKRWYLLGSPLQGTISGEWYAPTGTAQQKTTYYDPVTFGTGYDRYSPAIYQRSWDKAKAVLYEVGSIYATTDDAQTGSLGTVSQGQWQNNGTADAPNWQWQEPTGGADAYLDRLGYKPMDGKKANVAIKGIWSNTYNDAQVDYAVGGFSVMVMNHLKGNDTSNGNAIIRLPKEDTFYDYYGFDRKGGDNVNQYEDIGTNTQLSDVRGKDRAKNRGRLKTDRLLPVKVTVGGNDINIQKEEATASVYGDQRKYTRIPIKEDQLLAMNNLFKPQGDDPAEAGFFAEIVPAGVSEDMGFYLVENPFPCGLDMDKFFAGNTGLLKKYWLLTATGQQLVQKAKEVNLISGDEGYDDDYDAEAVGDWIVTNGNSEKTVFKQKNAVVAPGQGFFVQTTPGAASVTITFNKDMRAQSRFGKKTGESTFSVEVGQTQRMEEMKENGETVYIDVDLNGNGIYGETGITLPGETEPRDEKEAVMVPVYTETVQDDPDNPGQTITIKTPVLDPVMEDVTVSRYVQSTDDGEVFPLKDRTRSEETNLLGLVITAERDGNQTSALVMQREDASDDFLPTEDTEVFITSDFESVPTVYTLCGRLATTINSIHEFRSLPLGVESNSDAPCTLTFKGVEALGDSVAFYDALEQTLTPLESGMTVSVSGQTQNRYYLVRSLIKEEAAAETHIQIFTEGLTAKVIASTAEPIVSVRCFDTAGRLIHSASPQSTEYSFTLPISGVYIIEAETENDRKTKKLMAR